MDSVFYDVAAEDAVLGWILSKRDGCTIVPQIASDAFYEPLNAIAFKAMQAMYAEKRQIDLITLDDELRKKAPDKADDVMNRMVGVVRSAFGTEWSVKGHIEIIKNAALRRHMYSVIEDAKNALLDAGNETADVLEKTRQALRDVVVSKHSWQSISDVMLATYGAIEKKSMGEDPAMPTGVAELDRITMGMHRGEMTIIGARPAVGKSALGAHIALSAALKGYKVGVCSREMTDIQYGTRIIARDVDISNDKLRSGDLDADDWAKIADVMGLYGQLNMSFLFSARYIEDLRMEAQRQVDSGNLDMLLVDYVQLMQTRQRFDKDYLRIAYVSKMLKDMTTDLNISVIALAQVGRSSSGAMPTLAELRGSGDLEQDADNVIFMHRPTDPSDRYIHPDDHDLFELLPAKGLRYIALDIAKQRQGQTGSVAMVFDPARMRFTSIERRRDEK